MKLLTFGLSLFTYVAALAQTADSTKALNEVIITAYETQRPLLEIAAPVNYVSAKDIRRFDNTSLLPALNALPGVRMEERSPGSYRISIRGSSVRSPFGVRNVKVYWNNIPLSDANGITYFNLLDMSTLGSMELLKGPAGSMYGASTGGVILLKSRTADANADTKNSFRVNVLGGAFGTQNFNVAHTSATEKINSILTYARIKSNGYRAHTNLQRDILNWRSSFFYEKNKELNINVLYANLNYQTPGGLTAEQAAENPKQARPATRFTPSAVEQQAAIRQRLFTTGVSHEQRWDVGLAWASSVFGTFSHLENPFITNYEIRDENSMGGRSQLIFTKNISTIASKTIIGVESIRTYATFDVYDNLKGQIGNRQAEDEATANQTSAFFQEEISTNNGFIVTIGGSLNKQRYRYFRRSTAVANPNKIDEFSGVPFTPRIAILKKIGSDISIYGSISNGFSPPTVQEFATGFNNKTPSFNILNAEQGRNYEIGSRGDFLNNRLRFDASVYAMRLSNTIVRRLTANELEQFVNAGTTQQNGAEVQLNAVLIPKILSVFSSYTFNDYRYKNYQQTSTDFSGNKIPSVPQNVWVSGVDVNLKSGLYGSSQLNYTDKIFLNDANTVFSDAFWLLNARIGWRSNIKKIMYDIFIDGDNLLNATYSLGNDTNAFGNRFFNPAAPRNFRVGLGLKLW